MKKLKKVLSVVISLIMVFSAVSVAAVTASASTFGVFPSYNSSQPNLVIGTVKYTGNGNVVVPVKVAKNPGIWGVNIQIKYDSNLTFVAPASGKNLNSGCSVLTGSCLYSDSANVITLYVDATGYNDSVVNGTLVNLTFTPKAYNVGTTYPISFTCTGTTSGRHSIVNSVPNDVDFTYGNGGVECVKPETPTPAKPAMKSVAVSDKNQVKVTWGKAANAKSYEVQRKIGSGSWSTIKTTTALSYTDNKATKAGTYYYRVRSVNGSKKSAYSSYKTVKVMSFSAKPTTKATAAKKALTAKISKKVTNATGYQYQASLKKNMKSAKSYRTTKTSYKFSKLKAKKTYYVRARAYKKIGSKIKYGAWSKTVKVKTK